jgi:AAA family ATP:ADP antiporter
VSAGTAPRQADLPARPPLRWLIAAGEGRALLGAAIAFFCLLCGYYMLRPLREAMALEVGRGWNAALFGAVFAVQLLILPLYWALVARVSRRRLPLCVYGGVVLFFGSLAILFAILGTSRPIAALFFLGVTSLNLFMVSVFWSVMADFWPPEAAKRLFGFVAAGGSLGALAGPALAGQIIVLGGPAVVLAVACVFFVGTVSGLEWTRSARAEPLRGAPFATDAQAAVGGRAIDDLRRLLRSRYLLAIVALVVIGQILGAFMYNEQARYVEGGWVGLADRTVLFAHLELAVNLVALLLQGVVVGWLTARTSLRTSLSVGPALGVVSFVALALVPQGFMVLVTNVVRRALDYGMGKPTREMLFTVLNPESKFKSKSLIDTVLQRGSDTLGQTLYLGIAGLGLAAIGGLSAVICVALVLLCVWLGARFEVNRDRANDKLRQEHSG